MKITVTSANYPQVNAKGAIVGPSLGSTPIVRVVNDVGIIRDFVIADLKSSAVTRLRLAKFAKISVAEVSKLIA